MAEFYSLSLSVKFSVLMCNQYMHHSAMFIMLNVATLTTIFLQLHEYASYFGVYHLVMK